MFVFILCALRVLVALVLPRPLDAWQSRFVSVRANTLQQKRAPEKEIERKRVSQCCSTAFQIFTSFFFLSRIRRRRTAAQLSSRHFVYIIYRQSDYDALEYSCSASPSFWCDILRLPVAGRHCDLGLCPRTIRTDATFPPSASAAHSICVHLRLKFVCSTF